MILGKRNAHIKELISSIPCEDFLVEKLIGDNYFDGIAVVRNNKLAGRIESIKFLEAVEPHGRERFLNEAKVLAAMRHRNIPLVYDIIAHDDLLLFRTEYIDGYSVREVLDYLKEKREEFPRLAAASIILKLMNALEYAHNQVVYEGKKKKVIHCDIKPSNIILSVKGYTRRHNIDERFIQLIRNNRAEPYLIDFGIAKFTGTASDGSGTIPYMRQMRAKVDWRTDLCQLLLVYYELLANRKPYSGLSRSQIEQDFKVDRSFRIPTRIRELIEKGTRKRIGKSFRSEKECILEVSKVESSLRTRELLKKFRLPLIAAVIVLAICSAGIAAYRLWDYTQSTDYMIKSITQKPNMTTEELDAFVSKIQQRAFYKKYYQPLLRGEFRDRGTGKPLYPSHLDASGKWVFEGPQSESAGAFAGLLFHYSDRYPGLLAYAKEYAEPILKSEFDSTAERRYMYALIPAYEKTRDERYLTKLINVSDALLSYIRTSKGATQCADLHLGQLFLFVYNHTGDRKYLEDYDAYLKAFIQNNIDSDGYIYVVATVNLTSVYGDVIPDDKTSILVSARQDYPLWSFFQLGNMSVGQFKNATAAYSRDYVITLATLDEMRKATGNPIYAEAYSRTLRFYLEKLPQDNVDYLFVSSYNEANHIPKDTLAAADSLSLIKGNLENAYREKLRGLLSTRYFQRESEAGVLKASVRLDGIMYQQSDEFAKNQTLVLTDAVFLGI